MNKISALEGGRNEAEAIFGLSRSELHTARNELMTAISAARVIERIYGESPATSELKRALNALEALLP